MNRILEWLHVDAKRFRLLNNLFWELSERREFMTQLGREGMSLKIAACLYAVLSAILSLLQIKAGATAAGYFSISMLMTAFLLLCILVSETSNSLVNPVEGLVLAHQPIDGATYIAAKLIHLARIVAYLSLGFGVPGAICGLWVKGTGWSYPLLHLGAAYLTGLAAALFSCAVFGWLMRFVPPSRLKSVGQTAEIVPWFAMMFASQGARFLRNLRVPLWLPIPAVPRIWLLAAGIAAMVLVVVFGIRSLSVDYLVRVSSIVQGSAKQRRKPRWKGLGDAVESIYGAAGRAGYEYLGRLMWRDWQFRRQLIPMAPSAVMLGAMLVDSLWKPPFGSRFTAAQFFPHVCGGVLFLLCSVLRFGSHPKGVWVLLLAPGRVLGRFACGIHAYLWTWLLLAPHLVLLAVLVWTWGPWQAFLFTAFSLAVGSCYLAAEVRMIEYAPFSRPAQAASNLGLLGLMALGGLIIAVAVALQHFLLFRSPAAVAAATLILAGAVVPLTRRSLDSFEGSMRYNLGLESEEVGRLYVEVV